MIPSELYRQIVDVLPILCVDVVLTNQDGETLLVRRKNQPLKGQWWVVGGRVLKGETLRQAAERKVREELSLSVRDLRPLGYYEDFYDEGSSDGADGLHTIGMVFASSIDRDAKVELDGQSSAWKFSAHLPERFFIQPFHESGPSTRQTLGP